MDFPLEGILGKAQSFHDAANRITLGYVSLSSFDTREVPNVDTAPDSQFFQSQTLALCGIGAGEHRLASTRKVLRMGRRSWQGAL